MLRSRRFRAASSCGFLMVARLVLKAASSGNGHSTTGSAPGTWLQQHQGQNKRKGRITERVVVEEEGEEEEADSQPVLTNGLLASWVMCRVSEFWYAAPHGAGDSTTSSLLSSPAPMQDMN